MPSALPIGIACTPPHMMTARAEAHVLSGFARVTEEIAILPAPTNSSHSPSYRLMSLTESGTVGVDVGSRRLSASTEHTLGQRRGCSQVIPLAEHVRVSIPYFSLNLIPLTSPRVALTSKGSTVSPLPRLQRHSNLPCCAAYPSRLSNELRTQSSL